MPAVEQLPGPTAFGKYTLLAKLATGGMGEVFLARSTADAGFQKLLVIKRLLPHLTAHQQFVNMFLDEARLAAQLHHPNICQIYELGKVASDHFMSMEYVEGIQLATLLRGRSRSPRLSDPRLTCALLAQACEALHYAHNLRMADGSLAGVVHRDVNPKNIMVTSAGTVKVLDFGVAKARGKLNLSRTGTLKGTYSYMSPEQLRGDKLDRRSDIFSLGIIAWESVTGRRLFKRPTDVEVWRAIAEKPIPRASALAEDVSEELDGAIARALSRDRNERFATAREFALALEESLSAYGAPLSTVAIAAEVDRCFASELEELRTVVMRAQRLGGDDEDEDFDAPTRLFDDGRLQAKLTEMTADESLEAVGESASGPASGRDPTAPPEPAPKPPPADDEIDVPITEGSVADAIGPVSDEPAADPQKTTLGVGPVGDESSAPVAVRGTGEGSQPARITEAVSPAESRPVPMLTPPPSPPSTRLSTSEPGVRTSELIGSPRDDSPPLSIDDVNIKKKINWTPVLIVMIAALILAVIGHYVWSATFSGDDSAVHADD